MDKTRVLIVDDEVELTSTLTERLQYRGFEAEGVTTGENALEYAATKRFDVVVLDVKMPGLGGLDVIREIKKRHPKTEVILITGHGVQRMAEEGERLGAFRYVMKPIKIDALVDLIQQAAASGGRAEQ